MSYSISIDDSVLLEAFLKVELTRTLEINWKRKNFELTKKHSTECMGTSLRLTKIKHFPAGWNERWRKKEGMCLKKQRKRHFLSTWICDLTFIHVTYWIKVEETVWETLGKAISTQKLSFIGPVANVKIKDTWDWSTETWRAVISQESCRL